MAHIAALVGPEFEDCELTHPARALGEAGHTLDILGRAAGETVEGKSEGTRVKVQKRASQADPADYAALLIPGGHAPDHLRIDPGVVGFVRAFDKLERPIAAICHGPQLLIEAGVVQGRRLTSWPSVRTDLKNAGAEVVDAQVCEDGHLITSRKPDDLDAFSVALLERLGGR